MQSRLTAVARKAQVLATAMVMAMATLCACQVEPKMANRRSAGGAGSEEPRGEPVEIDGSFGALRTYHQSRGIVSLNVKSSMIRLGDHFSLLNETTGATLIDQDDPSLSLAAYDPSLTLAPLSDAYDLTLRIYLSDPTFAGSFAPGDNVLRLNAMSPDAVEERTAKTTLVVRDFPLFSFGSTTFESGGQRRDGFQGGFEPLSKNGVTSGGKAYLSTGFITIVNQ